MKNKLRKVKLINTFPNGEHEGWFHLWLIKKDLDEGMADYAVGLIEKEDGSVIEVGKNDFKFLENPNL